MIDLTRLRYFLQVAEAGSFSRAARRLGVTQPTLSVQVARLEEELGFTLLERGPNGTTLTEGGRRLQLHAQDLFARIDEIEHALRQEIEEPTGELRIGTVPSVSIFVLPETLATYTKRYPRVRISAHTEHSDNVLEMLDAGEIDVGFIASPTSPPVPHTQLLGDDPVLLACGAGHRFWGRRFVRPADLEGESILELSGNSPTSRLIDDILGRNEVRTHALVRTPCIASLVQMVSLNIGVSFLPALALRIERSAHRIHAIEFEPTELHRGLWAGWVDPAPNAAREAFIASLRQNLTSNRNLAA